MLVLSRRKNEEIVITASNGEQTVLTVVDIRGDKVRLGFHAPTEVTINRGEVQGTPKKADVA